MNVQGAQKSGALEAKDTYDGDFRGWLTHFFSSLFPNAVRVWSRTQRRLPFTVPVVWAKIEADHYTGSSSISSKETLEMRENRSAN